MASPWAQPCKEFRAIQPPNTGNNWQKVSQLQLHHLVWLNCTKEPCSWLCISPGTIARHPPTWTIAIRSSSVERSGKISSVLEVGRQEKRNSAAMRCDKSRKWQSSQTSPSTRARNCTHGLSKPRCQNWHGPTWNASWKKGQDLCHVGCHFLDSLAWSGH